MRGDEQRPARRTARSSQRREGEAPPSRRRPAREQRPQRSAPQTAPIPRPVGGPARPKNIKQAKARAEARKAKAPRVVRPPLRERLALKLASIDLNPRGLIARVPFVVLVIGALGLGLGVTLWLSTDAAERSYQLGSAKEANQGLLQQKEALERDVLEAQAAPALAESARELGMIPSRDTAHLVQDPAGNWIVVGTPKPAEGVPPPPLNIPLPEEVPPSASSPAPRVVDPREVVVRVPSLRAPSPTPAAGQPPAVPLAVPPEVLPAPADGVLHGVGGQPSAPGPDPSVLSVPAAPLAEVPATPAPPAAPAADPLAAPVPGPPA